jgi:hypothetical protein
MKSKFNLKQIVYLKHDLEQVPRMVTAITFDLSGIIIELSCGLETSRHHEAEVSEEQDKSRILGIEMSDN